MKPFVLRRGFCKCFTAFFLSFMLIIITIIMITMVFPTCYGRDSVGVVCFCGPSPDSSHPSHSGKKTLIQTKYCLVGWRALKDKWVELHLQKNQNQQQLISSRSCDCWREQVEATTVKQMHVFTEASSRAGHWTGFGFWICFRKTKIIQQRRNKKKHD